MKIKGKKFQEFDIVRITGTFTHNTILVRVCDFQCCIASCKNGTDAIKVWPDYKVEIYDGKIWFAIKDIEKIVMVDNF